MEKQYSNDGNVQRIDPRRLTIGNVVRMAYRGEGMTPFNDCVVLGIRMDLSAERQKSGLGRCAFYETLQAALNEAKPGDIVSVVLARPYLYADNAFLTMPNCLMNYERYEVSGDRIAETHNVIVNSKGEYACFITKKPLHSWEVIVGDKSVYRDLSEEGARATYNAYVNVSRAESGKVKSSVTLLKDHEVVSKHE